MRKKSARRVNHRSRVLKFKLLFMLIIVTLLLPVLFINGRWDGKDKLDMVIAQKSGDVLLVVFDTNNKTITSISIPRNTQVRVANQLGTWQIGSVWKLGEQQGLGGSLLLNTTVKSFKFPATVWASDSASGFVKGGLFSIIKSTLNPYKSNLTIKDKIRLALFSPRVSGGERIAIDLAQTGYLEKTRLLSGEEGYIIKNNIPTRLISLFSIDSIAQIRPKTRLINHSGSTGLVHEVADIIDTVGAKVVSVEDLPESEIDCEIRPSSHQAAKKLSEIFSCQLSDSEPSGFDLEIEIGTKLLDRF